MNDRDFIERLEERIGELRTQRDAYRAQALYHIRGHDRQAAEIARLSRLLRRSAALEPGRNEDHAAKPGGAARQ